MLRSTGLIIICSLIFTFPISAQVKPVVIENQRELFVDDYLVDKLDNIEMRLAIPVSGGVALKFDDPWEGQYSLGGAVMKIDDNYRLYYRAVDLKNAKISYAESPDGIHWTKPKLGQVEIKGSLENNVLEAGRMNVFYDDRDEVPAKQKFKTVVGSSKTGLFVYVSEDGFSWERLNSDTTAKGVAVGHALDSPNIITWVPSENQYAIYMRVWTGDTPGKRGSTPNAFGNISYFYNGARSIMRSTSKDLINWSEPVRMKFGNTPTEHLYTNATQPYFRAPQILIALPMRYEPDSTKNVLNKAQLQELGVHPAMWQGMSDGVFMTSRGGDVYSRKFMQSFVRPGLDEKNWAARSQIIALGVVPTSPEEMSFYVTRNYGTKDIFLERLTLRTDGFASLHADFDVGIALTKPVILRGNKLLLNHSTSPKGYVKVVLIDLDGKEIPGFGLKDAEDIRGDKISEEVKWKSGKTIKEVSGKKLRIKFIARDADIYSFAVCNSIDDLP